LHTARALALGRRGVIEHGRCLRLVMVRAPDIRVLRGELVRSAKDETKRPPKVKASSETGKPNRDLGDALRQAYDEAVREDIPNDLLDLLKKLD
jgi:hypothetical protein